MLERHMPSRPGTFSLCQCGHEPRHIMCFGSSSRESNAIVSTRHMLECRCGRTTARHASLQAAEAEWGPLLSQIPLNLLPAPVVPLRRRAPRKEVRHG